jgi:hypothetical protein
MPVPSLNRAERFTDPQAWDSFPHDHARSQVYRWNEDGLGGICDDRQRLCFAFAFSNGCDPTLKERIFGLTGPEGNHGPDAKEYWWHLDSTPSHSWMRWRYLYPQAEFPSAADPHRHARKHRVLRVCNVRSSVADCTVLPVSTVTLQET